MYKIGIDVGGTFTDFALFDEDFGKLHFQKVPSTPSDPSEAVEKGLKELISLHSIDVSKIRYLGHGTTVALNMLLERRAPSIGLLTTKGFRDVLEIGRQIRPHLYDYQSLRPQPLARRFHRLEIPERVSAAGQVLTPLDSSCVEKAALQLSKANIKAVAICFLHSYRFPDHERLAGEIVRRILPNAFISLSSDVLPEFREYERISTTAVNVYVGSQMRSYMAKLQHRITSLGILQRPYIIHSNGGLLTLETATSFPVRTCLSGPAAGVVGAAAVASAANCPNILAFDVGGTSTDISLVLDSRPLFTSEREIAGHPVKSPAIDVNAIGAGGGSIAWIDGGGALKVGPQSAGADPGPAAYDRGGRNATLTDANIALGRLNPKALLGGRMAMNYEAACYVIDQEIATPLGLSVEEAANGIIRVAASGIARIIRSVATAKGHNPGDFSLFAYGGAGPLLAIDVNDEVGCKDILVQPEPGTLCAQGILMSDRTFDFVHTVLRRAEEGSWDNVQKVFEGLEAQAVQWFVAEEIPEEKRAFRRYLEARYEGQSFEIRVEISESLKDVILRQFLLAFHFEHKSQYSYDIPERAVEIVNCRLEAIGRTAKPPMERKQKYTTKTSKIERRRVHFGMHGGWAEAIVHNRIKILPNTVVYGPAIIEEMSATTIIPPRYRAKVDAIGNLLLESVA